MSLLKADSPWSANSHLLTSACRSWLWHCFVHVSTVTDESRSEIPFWTLGVCSLLCAVTSIPMCNWTKPMHIFFVNSPRGLFSVFDHLPLVFLFSELKSSSPSLRTSFLRHWNTFMRFPGMESSHLCTSVLLFSCARSCSRRGENNFTDGGQVFRSLP